MKLLTNKGFLILLICPKILLAQSSPLSMQIELQYRYQMEIEDRDPESYTLFENRPMLERESLRIKERNETFGYVIKSFKDSMLILNYNSDSVLREKIILKMGLKEGIRLVNYESGILRQEIPYVKNRIHGVKKMYSENGTLLIETSYVNGKREGDRIIYLNDGSKRKLAIVPYKNDVIDGLVVKYKNDSENNYRLDYKALFQKGKPNGKWETFEKYYKPYLTGVIISEYRSQEVHIANGIRQGKQILYRPDSSIKNITMYDKGKKLYTDYFSKDGTTLFRDTNETGKKNGVHKSFDDDGVLEKETSFKNGLQHGKEISYLKSGKIFNIIFYDSGRLTKETNYFNNGKIATEITRNIAGQRILEKTFYENGNLKTEAKYQENGTKIFQSFYRETGEKTITIFTTELNKQGETIYYSKNGEILWINKVKDGKRFGIYKSFDEKDILETLGFSDEEGNGYQYCYTAFCAKQKNSETYYLKNKPVSKEDFLLLFSIKNDVLIKK